MNCPVCGRRLAPGAVQCGICGARVGARFAGAIPPRSLGDLLSETFAIYGRRISTFLAIALPPQVLSGIAATGDTLIHLLVSLLAFGVSFLATAAAIDAVARHHVGRPYTFLGCYRRAWARFGDLILAGLIVLGLLFISAILILIIVGLFLLVYLAVALFFVPQAVYLEGKAPTAALGRSRELVAGSWWRVFGIGLVFILVFIGLAVLAGIPGAVVGAFSPSAGTFLTTTAAVVAMPVLYIGGTLVYLDLRARKEGYDLGRLAEEVAAAERR